MKFMVPKVYLLFSLGLIVLACSLHQHIKVSGEQMLDVRLNKLQLIGEYSNPQKDDSDLIDMEHASVLLYKSDEMVQFYVSKGQIARQYEFEKQLALLNPNDTPQNFAKSPGFRSEVAFDNTIEETYQYMGMLKISCIENSSELSSRNLNIYHPEVNSHFEDQDSWQMMNRHVLDAIIKGNVDAVSVVMMGDHSIGAEASIEEFLNQEGITTLGKETITINNHIVSQAEATGQNDEGITLAFYLFATEYDGSVYRFINYTTAAKYAIFEPQFKARIEGIGELTQ